MYIVLFPVAAPDYYLGGGGGRGGKNMKTQIFDFCHFCSCKGSMWGRASDGGGPNAPMPPPQCHHCLFFPEKHQTLHDLRLANCMHGNEMIIVDL